MIIRAETDEQIQSTFAVMHQLRPHLSAETYVATIRDLMAHVGYQLAALTDDGQVRAVAGYHLTRMLYCDRILVLDDFVTDERVRSHGYGRQLLTWLKEEGRAAGCTELHLISNVKREGAHRFYFREDFSITAFHFQTRL
ncbi:MAG: GNAT family N-acetyltransferase [Hymenobacteraceae bacterium]|nr:GNAT family N-acetyltransferase [Hymenobacteraceae bacterium]